MSRTRKHRLAHRHYGKRWCWLCTVGRALLRFKVARVTGEKLR